MLDDMTTASTGFPKCKSETEIYFGFLFRKSESEIGNPKNPAVCARGPGAKNQNARGEGFWVREQGGGGWGGGDFSLRALGFWRAALRPPLLREAEEEDK
jgi:hypothetical protein